MKNVAVVATGRMECIALCDSLQRLFPGNAVFTLAAAVDRNDPIGFTSCRVQPRSAIPDPPGDAVDTNVDRVVQIVAAALSADRSRIAADLVVAIEDLELANVGNEAQILEAVRESTVRHLRLRTRKDPQAAKALSMHFQSRASFHMLVPMAEAYFFADNLALDRAGVPRTRRPALARCTEDFLVDAVAEPGFLANVGECERHHAKKERKCKWDGSQNIRLRHPKKYISYLCREDAPNEFCTMYAETKGGVAALASIDWSAAMHRMNPPYLCALLEDVARAIGANPTFGPVPAVWSNAVTAPRREGNVWRNV